MEFSQRNYFYTITNCFNCPDGFLDGTPDGIGVENYHIRFTMQDFHQNILEVGDRDDVIAAISAVGDQAQQWFLNYRCIIKNHYIHNDLPLF